MALLRVRSRNRFVPLFVLALCIAFLSGFQPAPAPAKSLRDRPSARGQACAYTPLAVWGAPGEGIAARLGTVPGAIYLFDPTDRSGGVGRLIGDPKQYWAFDARVSPTGDWIAFHGRVHASESPRLNEGIGVMSSAGKPVRYFPHGASFAWSPSGTWLAVGEDRRIESGSPALPGLYLWNRHNNAIQTSLVQPSHMGWLGEESLLVQLGDHVEVINPRTGSRSSTGYHGTIVSSDGLYSLWPGENGLNTKVFEEETGSDVTERLFGPMTGRGLNQIRSAFWLRGKNSSHFMCVSGCDNVYGSDPRCTTAIIDAETGEILVEFPGEALGPSGDGKSAVLLRHATDHMESVNMEAMVRLLVRPSAFY